MRSSWNRSRHRRSQRWVIAAVAGLAACSAQAGKTKRPAVPVTVTHAEQADVPYAIVANGTVTPLQTATVSAQVDGTIDRVRFREGQEVRAGQVLFELDPSPYQAALDQAASTLARDSASRENTALEAARYNILEQGGYVTHAEAESTRFALSSATSTVAGDRAAVVAAQVNLDRATIRAPIGGRTGSLLLREGNVVHAAGATPLVVINQMEPMLVRFAVPASELPLLLQYGRNGGLAVTVLGGGATPATSDTAGPPVGDQTGVASADPARAATPPPGETGTLTFIDNAVDTTTGTIMLKATFPNSSQMLWPGKFVTASLLVYTERNALVVPTAAVEISQQGNYVYVVDSTGAAQERSVVVERAAGSRTVIGSGLRPGEQVVVSGQSRLTPGATVTVVTASDTARAAGRGQSDSGKTRRRGKPDSAGAPNHGAQAQP